jgi:hypothetical protein
MTNPDAIARAILQLCTDRALYARLQREAAARPIKTWADYLAGLWASLCTRTSSLRKSITPPLPTPKGHTMTDQTPPKTWTDLLYEGCLTAEWQMNDSERLGMLAVLAKTKPECAIEIGTYRGGSLSLISQYSGTVVSIDIDPSIPAKFAHFENVQFFTGQSADILPKLLKEFSANGIPVEFILIDGDHSTAGVQRDIEILLDYVPLKPLVVLMHDGFNPECRQGMLNANWARSPYVEHVNLDFVPGRMVEWGGGQGEMWGGLAMAYFSPKPRTHDLVIDQTSSKTFAHTERVCYGKAA